MSNKDRIEPLPLAEIDYSQIEKRVLAQMAEGLGVPGKMLRHGLNFEFKGTVTGRFSGSKPNFRELPPSKPLCTTCGHPVGYCGQC